MTNEELANKLRYFTFVAYGAEEKHKTLSESLPTVLFQASNTLLANVQRTFGIALGKYMNEEEKKQFNENLQASALLGLCVFDTRFYFAKQLSDNDAASIKLSDLKYSKVSDPTAVEIVKLVLDAMEHGKKVDEFEKTPPYVVDTLKNIAAEIFSEHGKAKFLDRLTEEERGQFLSGLIYLIMNVYLCGIAYVYLATKPANNPLQSFVKKTLNIK
jgi:hypothetical protein